MANSSRSEICIEYSSDSEAITGISYPGLSPEVTM